MKVKCRECGSETSEYDTLQGYCLLCASKYGQYKAALAAIREAADRLLECVGSEMPITLVASGRMVESGLEDAMNNLWDVAYAQTHPEKKKDAQEDS